MSSEASSSTDSESSYYSVSDSSDSSDPDFVPPTPSPPSPLLPLSPPPAPDMKTRVAKKPKHDGNITSGTSSGDSHPTHLPFDVIDFQPQRKNKQKSSLKLKKAITFTAGHKKPNLPPKKSIKATSKPSHPTSEIKKKLTLFLWLSTKKKPPRPRKENLPRK